MMLVSQERLPERLPVSLREVPDSWWAEILNGRQWYISMATFEIRGVELTDLRAYVYRRAAARGLQVTSMVVRRPHQGLYLQTYNSASTIHERTWNYARPAPAMHRIEGTVDLAPLMGKMTTMAVELLRLQGWTCTPPIAQPPAAAPHAEVPAQRPAPEARNPHADPNRPVPPTMAAKGWTRSTEYPYNLVPPPDLDPQFQLTADQLAEQLKQVAGAQEPVSSGASLDDEQLRRLADGLAALPGDEEEDDPDLAWLKQQCSCGTADIRFHEPSCVLVTGF